MKGAIGKRLVQPGANGDGVFTKYQRGGTTFFTGEFSLMRTTYSIRSIAALAVASMALSAVTTLYAQEVNESATNQSPKQSLELVEEATIEVEAELAFVQEPTAGKYWLGIACEDLTPALKAQLNIEKGVVVGAVVPETPAAEAGIQQYDVLLELGGADVASVDEVMRNVDKSEGQPIAAILLRGGEKVGLTVTPRKRPDRAAEMDDERARIEKLQAELKRLIESQKQQLEFKKPHAEVEFEFKELIENSKETLQLKKLVDKMAEFREGEPLRRVIVLSDVGVVPEVKLQFAGFPSNTSLMITKEGDQPARILVKKDGKKYEATEDELDGLPEDLRRLVAPLLGKQFGSTEGVKIQPWIELHKSEPREIEKPEKGAVKEEKTENPKQEAHDSAIKPERIRVRTIPDGARIEIRELKLADPSQGRIKVEIDPKQMGLGTIEVKPFPSKKVPEGDGAGIERRLDEVLKRLESIEDSLARMRRELDERAK